MQLRLILIGLALAACERSKPAPPAPPAPANAVDRCAGLPPLGEDDLDLAEAAIIDGGTRRVVLDPQGCRVYQLIANDGGSLRLQFQLAPGRVTYVRELSPALTLDFFDADSDGVFERELFEARDDAGVLTSGELDRDDAGMRRIHHERLSKTMRRTIRETWADGGWVVVSDVVEPRKPRILPIVP